MNNISDAVVEFEQKRWNDVLRPTNVMLMVFGVFGVIGNAIILIVYWKLVKMTTTQFLIFAIAVSDFLSALVAVPLYIVSRSYWIANDYFCRFVFATIDIIPTPSSHLLFIVTVVRYSHVCRPKMLLWIEPNIKIMCACSVLISLFYSILDAIYASASNQNEKTGNKSLICTLDFSNIAQVPSLLIYSRFVTVIGLMIGMMVLNMLIIINNHKTKILIQSKTQLNKDKSTTYVDQEANVDRIDLASQNSKRSTNVTSAVSHKSDQSTSLAENLRDDRNFISSNKSQVTHSIHSSNMKDSVGTVTTDGNNEITSSTLITKKSDSKSKRKSISALSDLNFKGLSNTTIMLSIVGLLYVLAYLPICTLKVMNFDPYSRKLPFSDEVLMYLVLPLHAMYYLGCTANPIVYTFVDPSFRSKCRTLIGY